LTVLLLAGLLPAALLLLAGLLQPATLLLTALLAGLIALLLLAGTVSSSVPSPKQGRENPPPSPEFPFGPITMEGRQSWDAICCFGCWGFRCRSCC
jgi:hypothetical protein